MAASAALRITVESADTIENELARLSAIWESRFTRYSQKLEATQIDNEVYQKIIKFNVE